LSSQAHLTRVSALSGPGNRPYPTSCARRPAEDRSSAPVSCGLSTYRHWLLGSSSPAGGLGLPCGSACQASSRLDPNGVSTFPTHEIRPGRVPPVSRGQRCSFGRQKIPGRRLPLPSGQPLHPACNPSARLTLNETSTEVHAIHPSGLPFARDPLDGAGVLRLSPRASHPAVASDARRG
jgi:hypothetical protein